jgi:hypothetical protein
MNRSTYYLLDSNYQEVVDQVPEYLLQQGPPTIGQIVIIVKWLTVPVVTATDRLTRS